MNDPINPIETGLESWKRLWTSGKTPSNVVPRQMREDWQAWFDKVAPNTIVAWCNGSLVKAYDNSTLWYFNGVVYYFSRDQNLEELSKQHPTIHNAFRDNYNYSPYV